MRHNAKVAVVTGAGSGIGQATAVRLAAEGALVTVGDLDLEAALRTVETISANGGRAHAAQVDVRDLAAMEALGAASERVHGPLDYWVNCAGIAIAGSVTEITEDGWHSVLDVNLGGVWRGMRVALTHLQGRCGAIVNVSSVQSLVGFTGFSGYAASKGGVNALTRQAAVEYAKAGVRINAVAPGTIMTPMTQGVFDDSSDPEALLEAWSRQHALGRFGQATEVAAAISGLLSDDSSFITGVCLAVDGGMTAMGPS